MNDNLIDV